MTIRHLDSVLAPLEADAEAKVWMHAVYLGDEPKKPLGVGSREVRQGREGMSRTSYSAITRLVSWDRVWKTPGCSPTRG